MPRTTISLTPLAPFDFARTAYSHGWVVLAPNSWDTEGLLLHRVERLEPGKVVKLAITGSGTVRQARIDVDVHSRARIGKKDREELARRVAHMFRSGDDLSGFYRLCRKKGGHWSGVAKGLGRLLRSPTVFEDVVKVICTTNIQWGGTKKMVAGLVEAYGEPLPDDRGRRAFPAPEAIAAVSPEEFAVSVRMGYRAPYVYELAEKVAGGKLDLEAFHDPGGPTPELKKRLLAIKGIGNYAAATLLMLLGRYDDLAIDTVCRDFVTKKYFDGKRPTDAQIHAIYEEWGEWKYLAYWYDIWAGLEEKL